MIRILQIFCSAILAISLLLQGGEAAANVTMRDAVGQIVICTGMGVTTILVDADGQPVEGHEHCPDCLILSMNAVLPAAIGSAEPHASARRYLPVGEMRRPAKPHLTALARAPPMSALI